MPSFLVVDGDIILGTDNPYFIKGSNKDTTNVIMYDKQPTKTYKITIPNLVKTDIRGFGTAVGRFSNVASIIETMKALFTKPEQAPQREELEVRKKLLREIVGAEIDKIKGSAPPVLPRAWTRFERVNPDDDDITKAEKYRHNSMVVCKKPYFFRYLYPELNKKYKQFERSYNEVSKALFGLSLKRLLAKENKTEPEMRLARRYHKFSPLINSNCTMNILCREFEDADFSIQYDKENISMLPTFEGEYECDEKILLKFRDMYRKYCNKKAVAYLNTIYDPSQPSDEYDEVRFGIFDAIKEDIQEELEALNLSPRESLFYIGQLSKRYSKFNWSFAWDILEDGILQCIDQGETYAPVEDENGEEYLGKKYVLKRIYKESSVLGEEEDEEGAFAFTEYQI